MPSMSKASRAYGMASEHRGIRQQEAEVFRLTIARLRAARHDGPIARVRALADNRRLWMVVSDLMRDIDNSLPLDLRASILSVGLTVQREMDRDEPDFDFLITINTHIAEGLSAAG